jgi:hypothetical protein
MDIKLSPIKQVNPNKLKANPENEKYFRNVTGSEIDALANDIKARGILVPLIAKKDGTLLAGHRRLSMAVMLELESVPVQYVQDELTADEETAFILKDNLFRRHLNPEERRQLYNQVVKGFEDKVMNKHSRVCGINTEELVRKTGLSPTTIKYDLSAIRQEKEKKRISKSVVDIAADNEIAAYKKAVARMLNVCNLESLATCKELLKVTDEAAERVKTIIQNIEIRKAVKTT